MKDKEFILSKLHMALQWTEAYKDLESLTYCNNDYRYGESVIAIFNNGKCKHINVSQDSGIAFIEDVIKGLKENGYEN